METTNDLPESTNLVDPRAVIVITAGDVQQVSQQTINRELSSTELMQVQAVLEAGLGNRTENIQNAICTVLCVTKVRGDLRDAFLKVLENGESLDSHEIMSAFQQALTAFMSESEWDVAWSEYRDTNMKPTEPLFILTGEDAQIMANDLIGRDLTADEMHDVRKGVEAGLEQWVDVMRDVMRTAIRGTVR